MRWDKLFDDLESQLEREITAEEVDLEAEEERLRLGRLSVRERLLALHEAEGRDSAYAVTLTLATGVRHTVHPVTFGRDWFSADVVEEGGRRSQCIVPIAAVHGITLTAAQVALSLRADDRANGHPSLSSRLGLPFLLRDLCRRRRAVELACVTGGLHGTIDRVGRDHLDLAVHERGIPRRDSAVSEYRLVPFAGVMLVRL